MPLRTFVIFLALSLVAHAGWLKPDVDFSNYDVPLYEQIVNRIKAKISNRLGEGTNTRDRYFIIPFAYENDGNDPEFSHSFISVIRVFADDKQPRLTQGLKLRRYKNREFEAFTISWLPRDFMTNPHLCVFKGTGARLFAKSNDCPLSPGRNFTLEETIKLGANEKNAVAMWGPYEIDEKAFDLAVKRKRLLDAGTIKYPSRRPPLSKGSSRHQLLSRHGRSERAFPQWRTFRHGFQDVGAQWHGPRAHRIYQDG